MQSELQQAQNSLRYLSGMTLQNDDNDYNTTTGTAEIFSSTSSDDITTISISIFGILFVFCLVYSILLICFQEHLEWFMSMIWNLCCCFLVCDRYNNNKKNNNDSERTNMQYQNNLDENENNKNYADHSLETNNRYTSSRRTNSIHLFSDDNALNHELSIGTEPPSYFQNANVVFGIAQGSDDLYEQAILRSTAVEVVADDTGKRYSHCNIVVPTAIFDDVDNFHYDSVQKDFTEILEQSKQHNIHDNKDPAKETNLGEMQNTAEKTYTSITSTTRKLRKGMHLTVDADDVDIEVCAIPMTMSTMNSVSLSVASYGEIVFGDEQDDLFHSAEEESPKTTTTNDSYPSSTGPSTTSGRSNTSSSDDCSVSTVSTVKYNTIKNRVKAMAQVWERYSKLTSLSNTTAPYSASVVKVTDVATGVNATSTSSKTQPHCSGVENKEAYVLKNPATPTATFFNSAFSKLLSKKGLPIESLVATSSSSVSTDHATTSQNNIHPIEQKEVFEIHDDERRQRQKGLDGGLHLQKMDNNTQVMPMKMMMIPKKDDSSNLFEDDVDDALDWRLSLSASDDEIEHHFEDDDSNDSYSTTTYSYQQQKHGNPKNRTIMCRNDNEAVLQKQTNKTTTKTKYAIDTTTQILDDDNISLSILSAAFSPMSFVTNGTDYSTTNIPLGIQTTVTEMNQEWDMTLNDTLYSPKHQQQNHRHHEEQNDESVDL